MLTGDLDCPGMAAATLCRHAVMPSLGVRDFIIAF